MTIASMLRSFALGCCITLTTQACVATQTGPTDDSSIVKNNKESLVESIKNPEYDGDLIRFSAVSNGCTSSSDFLVEHAIKNGIVELTIVRTEPDLCRKARSLMDIELDWVLPTDSRGLDVVFTNPEIGELEQDSARTLIIK